jgi:uncharacterized membrane-anchored protein
MSRRVLFFAAAVSLQVLILLAVPATKVWTRWTGETVLLAIEPPDPFDPMRGWHLVLRYEMGDPESFPGAGELRDGRTAWAVARVDSAGVARPVRLSAVRPERLAEGEILLRGRARGGRVRYGAEAFFLPENRRGEVEEDLREHVEEARAEVRVEAGGRVALVALRVADRRY